MDIIARGDFSISNTNGKTKFTFQIPATHEHDYVKEQQEKLHTPIIKPKVPGRNDPCPCGSKKSTKIVTVNNNFRLSPLTTFFITSSQYLPVS